ncbi:hypothetical protein CS542_02645 [Pedobacter sp. IW39]|nr:hypothetical protein CS542_02645 [Pedobacter sp. IW39]
MSSDDPKVINSLKALGMDFNDLLLIILKVRDQTGICATELYYQDLLDGYLSPFEHNFMNLMQPIRHLLRRPVTATLSKPG